MPEPKPLAAPLAVPRQAYAAQLAISCCLVLGAAGAVQAYAPRAAGGGVTWCVHPPLVVTANLARLCLSGGRGGPPQAMATAAGRENQAHPCMWSQVSNSLAEPRPRACRVMAVLNGNAVGSLFTPLVFSVKWCGSVAALGASLCLVGMHFPPPACRLIAASKALWQGLRSGARPACGACTAQTDVCGAHAAAVFTGGCTLLGAPWAQPP